MDNFEILEKLGDGAYSIVYKVKRKIDSKIYALKKVKLENLNEKEKENALNEVRILASVKSPFVISYKEAFIEDSDSSLCLVMEFADKGDLYQKITEFKKIGCLFEEVDIWKIFIQMTRGLKALHDMKILHRDLKSANIFLESDGSAKIGDLNVSKVAKKGLGYTQTGTPYYASPEVWKDNPYDSKSDIWSLGCVTYEMAMLHPPFRAQNMEGLYNKVIKGQYGKISEKFSNDLGEVIKMLLKVNPSDRPTCSQILKCPIVKKRLEYFQAQSGFDFDVDMDEGMLLKTIRIPKNILFLTDRLPGANYNESDKGVFNKKYTFPNNNLPNIKRKIDNEKNKNLENNLTFEYIDCKEKLVLPLLYKTLIENASKENMEETGVIIYGQFGEYIGKNGANENKVYNKNVKKNNYIKSDNNNKGKEKENNMLNINKNNNIISEDNSIILNYKNKQNTREYEIENEQMNDFEGLSNISKKNPSEEDNKQPETVSNDLEIFY